MAEEGVSLVPLEGLAGDRDLIPRHVGEVGRGGGKAEDEMMSALYRCILCT